ncbi:cobaltochelatase subunit CobN [Methanimicrococcus stummii]|uniref:cobaltochelatase subunit CobN n=1 Tax=Methanimicrococcus stummii TaxID=3028294 RepID=UPI0029313E50|nr:cobaltochelatase subunit CobN [Methanimicrococcus sp. Es2]
MSAIAPIALADPTEYNFDGYALTAATTTQNKDNGVAGYFEFDNIPAGEYFILATYSGRNGDIPYVKLDSIVVGPETADNKKVDLEDVIVTKCEIEDDISNKETIIQSRNQAYDLYHEIKNSGKTASSSGEYTVSGTLKSPGMSAGTYSVRPDSEIYLLKKPAMSDISIDIGTDEITIGISAFGAEKTVLNYTDKTKTQKSLELTPLEKEDDTPAEYKIYENYFEITLDKSNLAAGKTKIEISTVQDSTEYVRSGYLPLAGEYDLIAATVSENKDDGVTGRFEFENIPEGDYFILATYGGRNNDTPYVVMEPVKISPESTTANVYSTGNIVTTKADVGTTGIAAKQSEIKKQAYDLYFKIRDDGNEPESDGTYTITGTLKSPGMSAGSYSDRPDVTMYLIKAPVILGISETEENNKKTITVSTIDADGIEAEYKDADKNVIDIDQIQNAAEKIEMTGTDSNFPDVHVFTFEIDKTDLQIGYTDLTVTAKKGDDECLQKKQILNSDPAMLNKPRKVVIICGHETHVNPINELAQKYIDEDQNVDLRLVRASDLKEGRNEEEIKAAVEDADVVLLFMISTSPTWANLNNIIPLSAEWTSNPELVIFDDSDARPRTSDAYKNYNIPQVPGKTDTDANYNTYAEKVKQYWSNGAYHNPNLENMVNMILIDFYQRYDLNVEEPVMLPVKAIYHPHNADNAGFVIDYEEYIDWYTDREDGTVWDGETSAYKYDPTNPTVGIAFFKAYYPSKMEPIDTLIEEMEKRGINVIASYVEAPASFDTDGSGSVAYFRAGEMNAVMSFRYVGDPRFSAETLGVPVFNILVVDSLEEWQDKSNPYNSSSSSSTMKFVAQEMNGSIDPIAIISTEEDGAYTQSIPEQINWMLSRVEGQLNLQTKENEHKNIAVIYYNHGGGKSNIGASYLDVSASILSLLDGMKHDGYNVNTTLVPTKEDLEKTMIEQGINVGSWAPGELKKMIGDVDTSDNKEYYDTGKAVLVSKELYLEWFEDAFLGDWFENMIQNLEEEQQNEKRAAQREIYEEKLKEVTDTWGEAPGDVMVYNDYIVIPYINVTKEDDMGRVILTPQPSRSKESDIELMYHDTNIPPTHQYIAFYLWLQQSNYADPENYPGFDTDAIINMGRHGTQEWLPGKETALSRYDWPALMSGDIPIVYPYIVDGVGEGMVAKRRGNAVIIDHMTPAVVYAELYGDYAFLNEKILSYNEAEGENKEEYRESIINYIISIGIDDRLGVTESEIEEMDSAEFEELLEEVEHLLEDLKYEFMPLGLHVLGKNLDDDALAEMVYSMLGAKYIQRVKATGASDTDAFDILKLVLDGETPANAMGTVASVNAAGSDEKNAIAADLANAVSYKSALGETTREIDQILKALDGKFIEAGPGGDPVLKPHILPTGINFYTVDQRTLPTQEAWNKAVKLTDQLLEEYYKEHGTWPESIGYVLWAGETMRTDGVMEAQIMYLLGIKPVWNGASVSPDTFEVMHGNDFIIEVDGKEVVRPRIDVVVEISGTYRDTFFEKVLMLDRAIRLAYEQPDEIVTIGSKDYTVGNKIRDNTDAIIDASSGEYSKDEALSRIFGPASDSYGAGMSELIGSTDAWDNIDDLAKHYIARMGFVYNSLGDWGQTNNQDLYMKQLSNVDVTVHSRSSTLYGAVDIDDFYQYLGGLNAAVQYSREDGKKPDSFVMNLRTEGGKVESLGNFIENEMYARYLNQKWVDAMKDHGYAGAREIAKLIENIWGWQALDPDLISDKMMNDLYEHLLTGENGEWLKEDTYNYQSTVARLIQIAEKDDGKYWNASSEIMNQMVKDYVEAVVESGVACCHHTCGNPFFDRYVAGMMAVAGVNPEDQEEFIKIVEKATERPIPVDLKSGSTSSSGYGQAVVASVAAAASAEQQAEQNEDEGENGGGYGTDAGQTPGEVSGYQMTESVLQNSISSIRDFMENPTFSASSMIAIAMVILVVGAVFYGSRRKY